MKTKDRNEKVQDRREEFDRAVVICAGVREAVAEHAINSVIVVATLQRVRTLPLSRIKSKQCAVILLTMAFSCLSKKEHEFLFRVHTYVEGDISRSLFYMDIDALSREIGANKDEVYAISKKLEKLGLIKTDVAGYLEVIRIKMTSAGDTYVKTIEQP